MASQANIDGSWLEAVTPKAPYFMLTKSGGSNEALYAKGFSVDQLFATSCTGIITARDHLAIDYDPVLLTEKIHAFRDVEKSDSEIRATFFPGKKDGKYQAGDSRGWKLGAARQKLKNVDLIQHIKPILYRPFDVRSVFYNSDMVDWGREGVMRHVISGDNVALLSPRMTADDFSPLVSNGLISNKTASRYDQSYFFPLYLYPDEGTIETERRVNFDRKIYADICTKAGLTGAVGDELLVFDYIYGVLHSPSYRKNYSEFLKIDFPRIPFPASSKMFSSIAQKGATLRKMHLMEPATVGDLHHPFKGEGDSLVEKPLYSEDGRVFINSDQFFESVPKIAWEFQIGGYQPAQKWLKDRKGRELTFDDVIHYQKIIKILTETDRIMKEIDLIEK